MPPKIALSLVAFAMSTLSVASPLSEVRKIVGGDEASTNRVEWGLHFCGGSLLNADTVLTAAHYESPKNISAAQVRAGSLTRASGGIVLPVASATIHPNYTGDGYNFDIRVWKIAQPVLECEPIKYASLQGPDSDAIGGSVVTTVGWGAQNETKIVQSPLLRFVDVPVVSREGCNTDYGSTATHQFVTDAMICAGVTNRDSCQRDSGGPLLDAAGTLIGIVSWGSGCGSPAFSGGYASVASTLGWIEGFL